MTVTEDFIPSLEEDEESKAAPTYPTAFGITLTPAIGGVLAGVIGLLGGLYLLFNQLMPAQEKNQQLQGDLAQKQAQLQQKKASLQQTQKVNTELAQAKKQQAAVLTLFANEKTLDTLLLDMNRLLESSNAKLSQNDVKAKLKRFVPVNQPAEVITDGSLGPEVNGKLKRGVINVTFEGTYEQTESILREIERLQPLLIVRDYQSTLAPTPTADPKVKVVRGPTTITTSFQLQALMPVSPEEAAKAAATANQQKK